MDEISVDEAIEQCLVSLLADRLSIVCGAGLSMAAPSNLPSAAAVAVSAKQKYETGIGAGQPALSDDIEEQAEFFFQKGELDSIYFAKLVDPHAFAGKPNPGHYATADLLLVKAFQSAVSTNVDTLVECAGNDLFGQVESCLDGNEASVIAATEAPFLKVHGCRQYCRAEMVWAPSQVEAEPIKTKIERSENWLKTELLGKDLLIVGFWTDWDYLLEVIRATLGKVCASKVFLIDLADPDALETKAPALYEIIAGTCEIFLHVKTSASDFLNKLRIAYSKQFVQQALHKGKASFEAATGQEVPPDWLDLGSEDIEQLWSLRRDIEGASPNAPATLKNAPEESLYGMTILQLIAAGATLNHNQWKMHDESIRVLRAANQTLAEVKAKHSREESQISAPTTVIAVGAEDYGLVPDISRGDSAPSITRGNQSKWMTRPQALEEFNL